MKTLEIVGTGSIDGILIQELIEGLRILNSRIPLTQFLIALRVSTTDEYDYRFDTVAGRSWRQIIKAVAPQYTVRSGGTDFWMPAEMNLNEPVLDRAMKLMQKSSVTKVTAAW